ncbi:hypothetical protein HQ560_18840, partial [bacterium]|nr:hypothetical protein [bacterium]
MDECPNSSMRHGSAKNAGSSTHPTIHPSKAPSAAILTPIAQGGIAVIHVTGPDAASIVHKVFRPARRRVEAPDRLHYGHILRGGAVVDEVLVR